MITRRDAVLSMLFGSGLIGLRALASGIPAAILLDPRRAMAAADSGAPAPSAPSAKPQFVIFSTSLAGDPVNCNAPGTYDNPNIPHPDDPSMAATPIALGTQTVKGAKVWSTLPAAVLARTCFFHHATYTFVHPDEEKVLRMMGAVAGGEMLPSMLSRELAAPLGTVRTQPITIGGYPIYSQGAPQPQLSPTTLSSVLTSPTNGLGSADLVKVRDQTLDALNKIARSAGNNAQRDFIDQYATSATQLRTLQNGLLGSLAALKDDSEDSQMQAAMILFQMKVTPVVVVHVSFGGDNHFDAGLATEVKEHQSGMATLSKMTQGLADAKLQDQVTFAMMNVFGRTINASQSKAGRQHLDSHHVTVMIGPAIKGGVVGGLAQADAKSEFAALPIDPVSGIGSASGAIGYRDTFGAMGKTLAAAVGLSTETIDKNILSGAVVKSALG